MTPTTSLWTSLLTSGPVVAAATVGVGVGGCRLAGVDPHRSAAVLAAVVAALASIAAAVPRAVARRQPWTPTGPAQAALLSMVTHLGLTLMLALATVAITRAGVPFAAWMLVLFWATLVSTALACARLVRRPIPPGAIPPAAARAT